MWYAFTAGGPILIMKLGAGILLLILSQRAVQVGRETLPQNLIMQVPQAT